MFCDRCQTFWDEAIAKAVVPNAITSCEDIRWAAHEVVLHRSIGALKRSSDAPCRLCRIIFSTPTSYEHSTILQNHDESIDVVLKIDPNKGPHPVLSAGFRKGNSNDMLIMARMVGSCSGLLKDDDLATSLYRSAQLPNDHTGSDGALQLAKYWLNKCTDTHTACRRTVLSDERSFVPTRLLDVGDGAIRLIETEHELEQDSERDFVALSHCWGLVPIIRTLKDNYEAHRKSITPDALSKTFREAISTTRQLGHRYIWIDSLCIIQDDGDDWSKEAATMADVYQCAVLTIAAAHAPGGDIGCYAYRDGLLELPFVIEVPQADSAHPPHKILFSSYGRVGALGGGDPVLFGRAWVLQEQLLSPRILMYDGTQLKWECLTMYGSESSPTSGITRHELYHKSIRTGIMDDKEFFDYPRNATEEQRGYDFWPRMKHQYWCNLVMDYTHRGMTKSKDRLVALAGIAQALSRHTNNSYWAGLWSDHFTTGLLWYIAHNENFQSMKSFDIVKNETVRPEETIAPSWTWAAVTTPVMYAQTEILDYDRICKVIDVGVSGGIEKQTGYATIRGHVRTGYLNPIYSHYIREAVEKLPHVTAPPPTGRKGQEYATFKGRLFHPNDYFIFSDAHPNPKRNDLSMEHVTRQGNFRLLRGSFKPDEIIDPTTEITFLAIAQQHFGSSLESLIHTHDDAAAIKVHALALVPTDKPGQYRRIGLSIWEQCAWYGYLCGWKDERDRRVYRPGNYSEDGYLQEDSWWDWLARKLWWDDLEAYDECTIGAHDHVYTSNTLPDRAKYHGKIKVEERTVTIV
ncbi:heterokaryon incompatibility protein-domain-containing protein [Paraphoma chrysanthemicola]|uniref:Heterokaryon incompatibility protein-domain-containing protein n=1 Tax=Paraphoma chrysanthemicola TaxID=798071 RepID=A0A8K0QV42_9PLEO|nr:heterokaryon incompatibility protein-domain-containing protein [Paraphoma chrysanthemicola]